jgi:hypothetical protein
MAVAEHVALDAWRDSGFCDTYSRNVTLDVVNHDMVSVASLCRDDDAPAHKVVQMQATMETGKIPLNASLLAYEMTAFYDAILKGSSGFRVGDFGLFSTTYSV